MSQPRDELDRYISRDPAADMLWSAGLGLVVGGITAGAVASALWPASSSLSAHALYIYEAGPAAWAAWLSAHDLTLRAAAALIPATAAGLATGIGAAWVTWPRRLRSRVRHIRGPRLFTEPAAAEAEGARLAALEGAPGIAIHPGVMLPLAREVGHMIVTGTVGGGKTQILYRLVDAARARGARIMIHDRKCDYSAALAGDDVALIGPTDRRGVPWDIAADVQTELDAELIAHATIRDAGGGNAFFSDSARGVFTGMLMYCMQTHGREWGWPHLAALFDLPQDDLRARLIEAHPSVGQLLEPGKTTDSVFWNLKIELSWVRHLAKAWPRSRGAWSITRWSLGRSRWRTVILQHRDDASPLARPLISAIVSLASRRLLSLSDSKKRDVWVLLDELPALPHIEGLSPLLSEGRSKGVRCVLAYQSYSQMVSVYGRDGAQTLEAVCGTSIYLRTPPGETAQHISELIGETESDVPTMTVQQDGGRSTSMQRRIEPLVRSEEVSGLPVAQRAGAVVGYLVVSGWESVLLMRWPFVSVPDARRPFVPAAWSCGVDLSKRAARKNAEHAQEQEHPQHIIEQRTEAPQPEPAHEQVDEPGAEAGAEALAETSAAVAAAAAVDPVVGLAAHTLDAIADLAEAVDDARGAGTGAVVTVTEQQPTQSPALTKRELLKRRLRARATVHEHEQE